MTRPTKDARLRRRPAVEGREEPTDTSTHRDLTGQRAPQAPDKTDKVREPTSPENGAEEFVPL